VTIVPKFEDDKGVRDTVEEITDKVLGFDLEEDATFDKLKEFLKVKEEDGIFKIDAD
jgi:hypothetical protein